MLRLTRIALLATVGAVLWMTGNELQAQGKSKEGSVVVPGASNRKKVKVISTGDAVVVARDVLVKHGYEVVRVEVVNDTRVIYYRAGNRGRGKGKGKLEKIVVRREPDRVVFVDAPSKVLVDINVRIGS